MANQYIALGVSSLLYPGAEGMPIMFLTALPRNWKGFRLCARAWIYLKGYFMTFFYYITGFIFWWKAILLIDGEL